jgi:adenylate kinase family enzyme
MVRELLMKKIVIIGSSGAGKSTFARELGSILKMKVFHLDRYFWQRGWRVKTRDTRIDILQEIVREQQWIIEGSYPSSSELHLHEADTIIFLDIPLLLCLWRLTKRHREYYGRSRRDIPAGSTDKLTMSHILKVVVFPLEGRRTIKQKLRNYKSKQIILLHSGKEVEDFLAQQKQDGDEKNPHVIAGEAYERMRLRPTLLTATLR